MAFSSGTFSLLVAYNPVVTGTTISSTAFNNTLTDIATGLTTCLLKDGTQVATAAIPFAQGISVGTNWVLDASGNLAVTTNKFTVTASSGNTAIAGTLGVTGAATLSSTLAVAAGAVGAPAIYLSTDTTTGWYRIGANNVGFSVSGTKLLDISSTGLGINVVAGQLFHVDKSQNASTWTKVSNGSNGAGAAAGVLFGNDLGDNGALALQSSNNGSGILLLRTLSTNEIWVQVNSANGVKLQSGGTAWASASDETLKTDLQPIDNAADKLSTVRTFTGRYKTDPEDMRRTFFIAQDIEKVQPEAVTLNDLGKLDLRYTEVMPLMAAATNEHTAWIAKVQHYFDRNGIELK